jgi:aminoglycoside 6'-N-acetyltransferase I
MREGEEGLWGEMRSRLWPGCGAEENARDVEDFRTGRSPLRIVFLSFAGDDAAGFAEISERSVVDGCGPGPAAYLEGWYVEPQFQRRGIGAALVTAAADWARAEGYSYFGSDAELHNEAGQRAHKALGFVATGRVVRYCMALKS